LCLDRRARLVLSRLERAKSRQLFHYPTAPAATLGREHDTVLPVVSLKDTDCPLLYKSFDVHIFCFLLHSAHLADLRLVYQRFPSSSLSQSRAAPRALPHQAISSSKNACSNPKRWSFSERGVRYHSLGESCSPACSCTDPGLQSPLAIRIAQQYQKW